MLNERIGAFIKNRGIIKPACNIHV